MASDFETDLNKFSSVATELNRVTAESIKTLPESVFVNRLLPILKEWVVEKKGDNVHLWAIAAGGIERPMIVALPNNEYLMVPPPFNHLATIDAPNDRENATLDSINRLIRAKEMDGESRTAMQLGSQFIDTLNLSDNSGTAALYTVQLAKIWKRYNLPMEQVLADIELDLDLYDAYGRYIPQETTGEVAKGDTDGDDELLF